MEIFSDRYLPVSDQKPWIAWNTGPSVPGFLTKTTRYVQLMMWTVIKMNFFWKKAYSEKYQN